MLFVDALQSALLAQWAVGREVHAGDLSRHSPCTGWSVHEVVNHSIGVTQKFTQFASGDTDHPQTPPGDLVGDDHAGALGATAEGSRSAWGSADLSRRCFLPFGEFPADVAAGINLVDVLAHTWDVSVATGVPLVIDELLWATAHDAAVILVGADRDLAHYGPAVAVSTDSPARQQFLGFLGRDPSWRPDRVPPAGPPLGGAATRTQRREAAEPTGYEGGAKNSRAMLSGSRNESPDP